MVRTSCQQLWCGTYQRCVFSDSDEIVLTSQKEVNEDEAPGDAASVTEVSNGAEVVASGCAPSQNVPEHTDDSLGLLTELDQSRWPDWLRKHAQELEVAEGPDEFRLVVEKFIRLEVSLGFPTGQVCAMYNCKKYILTMYSG
jgi:hypothetical protein